MKAPGWCASEISISVLLLILHNRKKIIIIDAAVSEVKLTMKLRMEIKCTDLYSRRDFGRMEPVYSWDQAKWNKTERRRLLDCLVKKQSNREPHC